MAVKVAINGFGRIGRLAFRQMFDAEGYEVVAINDLTKPSMLAHLLKYDSSQGKYQYADQVSADDEAGTITVCGKTLKIYAEADAKNLPWGELDVDVVLECTGFYVSKAKSQAHIDAGAKKVTVDEVNAAMKAAATESFGYNEELIVSSDIVGMRFGSLFDATQTMVSKISDDLYEVQVVSWYDNENSYTSQMVRTIKYFSELA